METLLSALTGPFLNLISKIIPDPDLRAKIQAQVLSDEFRNQLQQIMQQGAINAAEAASNSLFVAGWRPMIGWACGAAFVFNGIIVPILNVVSTACGFHLHLPTFDTSMISAIVSGMLGFGMGGLRSYDKSQGTDTKVIRFK